METVKFEHLLMKTAFCCMASDGKIDPKEVETIETLCATSEFFKDFDFKKEINYLVGEINSKGKPFIKAFLDELEEASLSEKEELEILDFAVRTIYADERIEYSEIKFFKTIRHRLGVTNETIRNAFPDLDDNFIEEDIRADSPVDDLTRDFLENSDLPQFNIIDFKE